MKIKPAFNELFLLATLLIAPLAGLVLCGLELDRRSNFERVEREFYTTDELHELQLRMILTSYESQTPEQIGRLHQRYLSDGSFARLDELERKQSQRIGELIRLCPVGYAPQLAACLRRAELRERASCVSQIPFPFRTIPRGMADYLLCVDPQ